MEGRRFPDGTPLDIEVYVPHSEVPRMCNREEIVAIVMWGKPRIAMTAEQWYELGRKAHTIGLSDGDSKFGASAGS